MSVPLHRRASKRTTSTFAFAWRDYALRAVHTPDVAIIGWSHLEITVVSPQGAPLPMGFSTRHVVEVEEEEILAAGGPVAFLIVNLERAAGNAAYAQAMFKASGCLVLSPVISGAHHATFHPRPHQIEVHLLQSPRQAQPEPCPSNRPRDEPTSSFRFPASIA
jgi:hypothetical protein